MGKKSKKVWKREGYLVLSVRVRPEVMEALDREVAQRVELERSRGLGEPKSSRTSVTLAALNAHLKLVVDE